MKTSETDAVNIELKPDINFKMLRISEGAFMRGDDTGAKEQRPSHKVATSEFEISRGEVTNRLYKFFVDATGRPAPQGLDYGRSEERRVGKECRSGWAWNAEKKTTANVKRGRTEQGPIAVHDRRESIN